jgi:nucleotide-binding universal stress UspA family protein
MGFTLVGVDGSAPSLDALRWAVPVAERRGSPLRAAVAWQYPSIAGTPFGPQELPSPEEMDLRSRESLERALSVELDGSPTVEAEVGRGSAAEVLLGLAAREDTDTLVVGASGADGKGRAALGSVSQRCVEHAPCPVVVVRGVEPPEQGGRRVLVALDGSAGARHALDWAIGFARDLDAEIVVVHAFGPGTHPDVRADAEEALRTTWSEPLRTSGLEHRSRLDAGDAREVLVRVAAEEEALLTVLGTRGLGPVRSLLLGSVASHVVRAADRPIAVVPPPG